MNKYRKRKEGTGYNDKNDKNANLLFKFNELYHFDYFFIFIIIKNHFNLLI